MIELLEKTGERKGCGRNDRELIRIIFLKGLRKNTKTF